MNAPERIALQQHPLSAAFPAMPEAEIEALAADIEKGGQRDPGVLLEGMVLDGWHRYLACQRLGIKFRSVEFDGEDPVGFVISKNLHRRHLSAAQRVAAVAECVEWAEVGRPGNRGTSSPILTTRQIAEAADASEKTVKQVKSAIKAGLGDMVKAGEVSAKDAAALAKIPPKEREKALKEPAPAKKKGHADDRALAELEELRTRCDDLAETARELEEKLTVFETTDLDEQQKLIAELQKKLKKAEGEIQHQKRRASDLQAKCNELIREVKKLRRG